MLNALAVDKAWTSFVILLVGDEHLREGREGGKDGATDPRTVLTLWRGNNLDLHRRRGKAGDLLLDTLRKALEHGGTAGKDDVGVEVPPEIVIALHDGVEQGLVDTVEYEAVEVRFEEELWAAEPLVSDGDDVAIWNLAAASRLHHAGSLHTHGAVRVQT